MRTKVLLLALVLACSAITGWAQDVDLDEAVATVVVHVTEVEGNTISGHVTITNLTEVMLDGDLIVSILKVNSLGRLQHVVLRNLGLVWLDAKESETVDFSLEVTTPQKAFTNLFTRNDRTVSGDFIALAIYDVEVDHVDIDQNPAGATEFTIGDDEDDDEDDD